MHQQSKYILDSTQQTSSWCCKFNQNLVQNQPQPNIPLRQSLHPTSKSKNKIQITSREKKGLNSKSFKKVHQLCPRKTLENSLKIKAKQHYTQIDIDHKPSNQTYFQKFQRINSNSPEKNSNRKEHFFHQIQMNCQPKTSQYYYQKKPIVIHQLDKKQKNFYNLSIDNKPQRQSEKKCFFQTRIDTQEENAYNSICKYSPNKYYTDSKYTALPELCETTDKKYSFLYSTMNCTIQRTARQSTANLFQSLQKKPLTLSRKNKTQSINPEEDEKIAQSAAPVLIKLNSITKDDRIREVESQFDSQENIRSQYSQIIKEDSDFFQNFHN